MLLIQFYKDTSISCKNKMCRDDTDLYVFMLAPQITVSLQITINFSINIQMDFPNQDWSNMHNSLDA